MSLSDIENNKSRDNGISSDSGDSEEFKPLAIEIRGNYKSAEDH